MPIRQHPSFSIFGRLSLAAALATAACLARAQPAQPPNGAPPGPPQQAIAACNGQAEGATVSFSGPRGESFTGICQKTPDGVLAARPAGGPPPAPR